MPTSPHTCAPTCQPLHPPQKGLQPNPYPPPATTRATTPAATAAATHLPSCAQNFSPNLTQSLAISRLTLLHLYVPFTFQRIGQRDNSYRLPAARIPLRSARCPCTKTAICAAAVNHPHHTNHVNHSSNKCQRTLVRALLPVQPIHPPHPTRHTAPIRKIFFREQKTHQFTQQFAPLRANLIPSVTHRQDTEQASHEPVPRFDPLCASAPPAATTPAAGAPVVYFGITP